MIHTTMPIYNNYITTDTLRAAYQQLLQSGEEHPLLEVVEYEVDGSSAKRHVAYYYKGEKKRHPFSFIVNSGAKKDYLLFYFRYPPPSAAQRIHNILNPELVSTNAKSEIAVKIRGKTEAQIIWCLVEEYCALIEE